jgi:putative ABC transport system permease protein
MKSLRVWIARFAGLFNGKRRDRDLRDEFDSHLQLHIDDNIRSGMTPVEARRMALVKFGAFEGAKEEYRDRRGLPFVETTAKDLRQAIRLLRRSPTFAVVAVLSLALGIGANTAIFSLINSLVLRPLPVREPHQLVQVFRDADAFSFSNPLWEQIRDRPELFDQAFAFSTMRLNLTERGETDYAAGLMASAGFFDGLGVRPVLGRLFTANDDRRGAPDGPVAVISHAFWQKRFGGSPDIVGQPLKLNQKTFTVIGVTPASFFGPEVGRSFDVVIPIGTEPLLRPRSFLDERLAWWLTVMARLKPGDTAENATTALLAIQPALRDATMAPNRRPEDQKRYLAKPMIVKPASGGISGLRRVYRQPLVVIMGVVLLVLLIACANIANLLLARGAARRHEFSVRLALGASRWRIVRQVLTESALLAFAGAAAGFAFAAWGTRLLVRQLSTPANIVFLDLSADWRLIGFTSAVAAATVVIFGVVPAIRATRVAPTDALKEQGRSIAGESGWSFGGALLIVQVALSLVLVVAAGLFLRTFTSLAHFNLGFDPAPIMTVSVRESRGPGPADDPAIRYRRMVDLIQAVPGVASAAFSDVIPVTGRQWDGLIENPNGLSLPETERAVFMNAVTPGWFSTMGTRLIAGRDLDWRDTKDMPLAVVVNQTFAAKYFPGRSPIGRTIREVSDPNETTPDLMVVGVVEDAVYLMVRDGMPPTVYKSMLQREGSADNIVVRAAGGTGPDIRSGIAAALTSVDKDLSLTFRPLAAQVDASITSERLVAMLAGFFGALAVLLAGLGLFGVVSYAVGRRRAEIGIRMALGASSAGVVRLVVRRVALLVGAGVIVGGALTLWVGRYVDSLLFGLEPRDPLTLAGAVAVLVAVAAAASWWPARRASRINPTEVRREG